MPGGKPLRLGPFIGGLNTGSDPTAIADAELVTSQNLELDIDGSLVSRPPIQELDGAPSWTERGICLCEAIFSGVHYLIVSNINGVFAYANSTWTTITTTFKASCAVQYADKVYLVPHPSASNPGGKWDPVGGFTAVAAIPKAGACVIHKERLYIVPGEDATTNITRLTFTDPGNFDVWPGSNFIDIGQGDGTFLLDVTVYQDNLLLFKNQATYVLAYDVRPTDAVVRRISSTIGVDTQLCVVNFENQVYTLHKGRVYEIVNYDFHPINLKVPFVLDKGSPSPFSSESEFLGILGDRIVVRYFSRVYVYGLNTRTWSEWTSARNVLKYFGPIVRINDPNGDIYYAGSSITSYLGLIRLFDDYDATNKERTLNPTYTVIDTFTRTVSNSWSNADTGQSWTDVGGAAADRSVNGGLGKISHGTRNVIRTDELSGSFTDFEAYAECSVAVVSLTNSQFIDFYFRRTNQNNNYLVRFNFSLVGALNVQAFKTVAGVVTSLAGSVAMTNYAINDKYSIRVRFNGTSIRIKAWKTSAQEPNSWNIFDGTDGTQASGVIAFSGIVDNANTNTLPVVYSYDNLSAGPLTGQVEDITCVAKTKNFDMAVSNQFKRLWWWGADVATNRDISGTATPIVISFDTTWSSLSSTPWNQLKTWAQPLTEPTGVTTMVMTGAGTARRFVKFLKALRYRQINFAVTLKTQGSTADGPAKLFTMMITTETKEGVSKAIS
jgi:hypothetical protein